MKLTHSPRNNFGFTLIELLVVVSIISMLSSIIFSVIAHARVKARANHTDQMIKQYINVLEMIRNDNSGNFPDLGGFTTVCLDMPTCYGNSGVSLSPVLTGLITPYFGGSLPPAVLVPVKIVKQGEVSYMYGLAYSPGAPLGAPQGTLSWSYPGITWATPEDTECAFNSNAISLDEGSVCYLQLNR